MADLMGNIITSSLPKRKKGLAPRSKLRTAYPIAQPTLISQHIPSFHNPSSEYGRERYNKILDITSRTCADFPVLYRRTANRNGLFGVNELLVLSWNKDSHCWTISLVHIRRTQTRWEAIRITCTGIWS